MEHPYSRLLRFYHQFGRFYARQFTSFLEETGLSMREIHVLLFLVNHPEMDSARDVTEYRGIAKSQVSAAVELLSRQGILRRRPDTEDRRLIHLELTEQGRPLARKAQVIQEESWRRILAGLNETEQAQLEQILEKLFDSEALWLEGEDQT